MKTLERQMQKKNEKTILRKHRSRTKAKLIVTNVNYFFLKDIYILKILTLGQKIYEKIIFWTFWEQV